MDILPAFKKINTFVLDIDGVLTDGSVLVLSDGSQARRMNIRDGYTLQLAVKKKYHVIIISGAAESSVKDRLEKLGIQDIFFSVHNKLELLQELMKGYGLQKEQVLYMGDDIPDLEVMQICGIACAPADAVAEIKNMAHYISPVNGGQGCVRDVMEKVFKMRGDWLNDSSIPSK